MADELATEIVVDDPSGALSLAVTAVIVVNVSVWFEIAEVCEALDEANVVEDEMMSVLLVDVALFGGH